LRKEASEKTGRKFGGCLTELDKNWMEKSKIEGARDKDDLAKAPPRNSRVDFDESKRKKKRGV